MALVTASELAQALGMPLSTNPALDEVAAAADTWLARFLTPTDHSSHEYCKRAALEVAVNMWSSPTAAAGQPVGIDFQPGPYQMGPSLIRKVSGLIAPCRSVAGMVG